MFTAELLEIINETTNKGINDGIENFYRSINESIVTDKYVSEHGSEVVLLSMLKESIGEDFEVTRCEDDEFFEVYDKLRGIEDSE